MPTAPSRIVLLIRRTSSATEALITTPPRSKEVSVVTVLSITLPSSKMSSARLFMNTARANEAPSARIVMFRMRWWSALLNLTVKFAELVVAENRTIASAGLPVADSNVMVLVADEPLTFNSVICSLKLPLTRKTTGPLTPAFRNASRAAVKEVKLLAPVPAASIV